MFALINTCNGRGCLFNGHCGSQREADLHETDGLLHIAGGHRIGQTHARQSLRDADQTLQLARRGRDHLPAPRHPSDHCLTLHLPVMLLAGAHEELCRCREEDQGKPEKKTRENPD